MINKISAAVLAVSALAFGIAPVAHAAEPVYDCGFQSVSNETVTGQNHEGTLFGYAADSDGDVVSIRCFITVNGAEVGAEATGWGTLAAVATGPVSYAATPWDDVDVCAEVNGAFAECFQTEHSQVPPPEVIDAINGVFDLLLIADPIVCPFLVALSPGAPGIVDVVSDGDVYVAGEWLWDCPPYGSSGGGGGGGFEGVNAGAVVLQHIEGADLMLLASTPNLSCSSRDSGASCSAAAGPPKCTGVAVEASLIPDGSSTVTGTVRCGQLEASATAGPLTPTASNADTGFGVHPMDCDRHATGLAVAARVTCTFAYA